ncbi:zinc-dependent peptidase [Ideonella sp. BN130291]|uniref:M90 family metallopeptidase n=1 Tax=Ideonella sp. BN130291 TaxID=3112940 RepID=UPI002E2765CB|nr:M90 family metallopeptidase [Ideonella sp. BN130291]
MPLLVLLSVALCFVAWLLAEPAYVRWRRARIAAHPFPAAWRSVLHRRVPYFRRLPVNLQLQLKRHMLVFLAEKPFIGCAGMKVTDEVRVTIAAQACLLLLNRPPHYFPGLKQILVYPGAFVVNRVHTGSAGVLQEQRQVLAGESWSQGQVILSWEDTLEGAAVSDDGRNVVLHEFAHQLDQETGAANGAPRLAGPQRYERWAQVLNREFEQLRALADSSLPSLLNPYGATDPAEFFAVATEVFFEQGTQLAAHSPALYAELRDFYRVDPLSWA